MLLKDIEEGKIVFVFGNSGKYKILSDQANWSQQTGMKPAQKDWASGVLVQAVDHDGNLYPDERSKPFASELRDLKDKAVTPHTC